MAFGSDKIWHSQNPREPNLQPESMSSASIEVPRSYSHPLGRLAVVGHLLASNEKVTARLGRTLEADTLSLEALTRLPGSFSGIITEPQRVTAFGDLAGQFPLYYRSQPEGSVAISTSAYELAQDRNSDLDIATLAARICGLEPLSYGHSSFMGVHQLMAGEALQTTKDGPMVNAHVSLSPGPCAQFADAAYATRQSITEALERRQATSSDFSGGIDSTSLAFATASLTDRAVSGYVHHDKKYPAGDILYARRFARLDPRIRLHESYGTNATLPYTGLADLDNIPFFPDEPYRGIAILGRELQRRHVVRDNFRSPTHLNGNGGDALYDSRPPIADLLRNGEEDLAQREATVLARTYLQDPDSVLEQARQQAARTLPEALQFLAGALVEQSHANTFDTGWFAPLSKAVNWLTPAAREALAERAMRLAEHPTSENVGIGDYATASQIRDSGDAQRHQRRLMGNDFELHAPYLDNNVIRAALSVPAHERNRAGRFKTLLKEALSGDLVPEQVYEQRTGKGNYSAEMYAGLRQAMPVLLELFQNSQLAAFGVINEAAVRGTLQELDVAHSFPFGALAQLVATEVWVRQLAIGGDTVPLLPIPDSEPKVSLTERSNVSPELLSRTWSIPNQLAVAAGPGQYVIFNPESETLDTLNSTAVEILRALNKTGDPTDAVNYLANKYPSVPESRLRTDVATTISVMAARGLVSESDHLKPRELPTWSELEPDLASNPNEIMRIRALRPEERFTMTPEEEALGRSMVTRALELKIQDYKEITRLLADLRQKTTRAATTEEAHRNMVLAHQIADTIDRGRLACYELSLAAVLMGYAQGLSTDWVIGAGFSPPRFHAWPEVDGIPITTGADEPVEGILSPWLRS